MARYLDKIWQDSMKLKVDFNNMMEGHVAGGIKLSELSARAQLYAGAADAMVAKRSGMRWRELPFEQDEVVAAIEKKAAEIRDGYDYFVVLGIGGSALGPIAVHQALCHLRYNELAKDRRGGPKLFVEDNVDPSRRATPF